MNRGRMSRKRRWLLAATAVSVVCYLGAYIVLRRQAIQRTHLQGIPCLTFVDVNDHQGWLVHQAIALLFFPLWKIDSMIWGELRPCYYEPLFELSSNSGEDPAAQDALVFGATTERVR